MLLDDVKVRAALPADSLAVATLLESEGLEAEFKYDEFVVAENGRGIIGCGRLKPLRDGTAEIASVAVASTSRGKGVGEAVVREVLKRATTRVYALALAPGFFEKQGFSRIDEVPPSLRDKAETHCASKGFVPMVRPP